MTDLPLVLLHGVGADSRMFAPVIERLTGDGLTGEIRIVAWDIPGYGGKPGTGKLTFVGLADQVVADLAGEGIDRAVFLGHSIGGMIAQEIAARRPDVVAALILSATTPAFGSRDGSFQQQFLASRLAPLDAGRTMPELAPEFVPNLVGSAADSGAAPAAIELMSALPEASFRAGLECLVTFDRRDELERIAVPTLLIAGQEDTNAPLRTMEKMAATIAGSRLEVLPGIGHLAPLETPETYTGLVRQFLETLREDAR